MKPGLPELLACTRCRGVLDCVEAARGQGLEIETASLICRGCGAVFPVRGGIPRFVPNDGYGESFGMQWNEFRTEQLDSSTASDVSRGRLYAEIDADPAWLSDKLVLEAGCGAGRFLEVAAASGAMVIGMDLTRAVDAAALTVKRFPNAHVVQASIYELPFRDGTFDLCYSIGVIQHTPDPARSLEALPRVVKPRGRVAVTVYERRPWTLLNTKYLVRPLTSRMPRGLLLTLIKISAPVLFPVLDVLFRVPFFGRALAFVVPFADYTPAAGMRYMDRYRAAILDTFDMLSPAFDQPQTRAEVERALGRAGIEHMRRLRTPGLAIVGSRR